MEMRKHTLNGELNTFFRNEKRIYRKVIKAYDVNKALLIPTNISKSVWIIKIKQSTAVKHY